MTSQTLWLLAAVAAAAGPAAWAGCRADRWLAHRRLRRLRRRAAARRRDPVCALSATITCRACRPHPDGPCTCAVACGHRACAGERTTLSVFTAAETAFLAGEAEMPR